METNKKVVIIEDDTMLGSILMPHLQNEGFDCRLITTGDGAFNSIKGDLPDLLILDLFLPAVGGLEILEMIRKDDTTKNLKVMIVSNSWESKDAEVAKTLGATFLMKATVSPDFIAEQVKKILA